MRKPVLLGTLTAGLLAALVAGAPSANASAYGYGFWGVHTFKDIPIPSGTVFGAVEGSGLNWDDVGGSFESVGTVCDWNFKVVFYDGARSDNKTTPFEQPLQSGCARTGAFKLGNTPGTPAKAGSVCIELYREFGDERLGAVCHNIFA